MARATKRETIINAFLDLLAEQSWEEISLAKIADKAGVKLSKLREKFDGKVAILEAFTRQIDAKVLDQIDADVFDELPREQLMDILLSRFDALAPYKAASATLVKAARRDLSLAAQLNRVTLVSMTWMLNGANIDTSGINGSLRAQGAALVFARVMSVWLNDDESLTKTMAALDRELRRGESTLKRLDRALGLFSPLARLARTRRAKPSQFADEAGDERFDKGTSLH